MPESPKYSDADVRAIIERATRQGSGSSAGALSHEELVAIGEQVGVAPGEMERAAQELMEARVQDEALRGIKSRRARWLAAHAAIFALINGLLFTVNALTTPGEWWVLFSVFFWGLGLLLHAGLSFGLAPSTRAVQRERRHLGDAERTGTARFRIGAGAQADAVPETQAAEEASASARGVGRSA